MTKRQEILLRQWWMEQLRAISKKLMDAEARREEAERVKAQKMLGEYQTESDIQDAYAYGVITKAKRDKLMDLLEKKDGAPAEDEMYRLKIEFLQEDFQHQKELIGQLTMEGSEYWA